MNKTFIGIDFSKKTFDATILFRGNLNDKGIHEQFDNNKTGFNRFERWIKNNVGRDAQESTLLCGENTGLYSRLVSETLYKRGYTMWLESALQIKRSLGLNRGKNDIKDSRDIAEYAARHEDKCLPYEPLSPELEDLRVLFADRKHLVKELSAMRVRYKETESESSPSLSKVRKKMSERIYSVIDKQIKDINAKMQKIVESSEELKRNYEILISMKGIGPVNAIALLIVTRNFTRFDYDARRICSYYGVAPFEHTSGTSLNGKPHVSPYADKYFKSLLSEAVMIAMTFNPEIRAYAERLLEKGKHPNIVRNNCKNKMIHILVAMVKNGTKYGENIKEKEIIN